MQEIRFFHLKYFCRLLEWAALVAASLARPSHPRYATAPWHPAITGRNGANRLAHSVVSLCGREGSLPCCLWCRPLLAYLPYRAPIAHNSLRTLPCVFSSTPLVVGNKYWRILSFKMWRRALLLFMGYFTKLSVTWRTQCWITTNRIINEWQQEFGRSLIIEFWSSDCFSLPVH
jgi:hypothetical protein